jgi:hypothetical protein
MGKTDYFQEREARARPFSLSAALLLIVLGINITATVLSLLAA